MLLSPGKQEPSKKPSITPVTISYQVRELPSRPHLSPVAQHLRRLRVAPVVAALSGGAAVVAVVAIVVVVLTLQAPLRLELARVVAVVERVVTSRQHALSRNRCLCFDGRL